MKWLTWLKKWAWLILAITAFVTGIIVAICLGRGGKQESVPIKQFTKKAVEKVQEIDAKAEEEKKKIRAEADEERKVVEDIKNDPQPVRRRRKVADWIADNL
jgi:membrane protein insertase Oxa1/YidC/SpoIIIJ